MSLDVVDLIWSAIGEDDFYSPTDLARRSELSVEDVLRVLEFLTRYGFTEQPIRSEPIFRKLPCVPCPGDTVRILQSLIEQTRIGGITRAASVSTQ